MILVSSTRPDNFMVPRDQIDLSLGSRAASSLSSRALAKLSRRLRRVIVPSRVLCMGNLAGLSSSLWPSVPAFPIFHTPAPQVSVGFPGPVYLIYGVFLVIPLYCLFSPQILSAVSCCPCLNSILSLTPLFIILASRDLVWLLVNQAVSPPGLRSLFF